MVNNYFSTPHTPHTPRQSLFVGNQQDRAGSPTPPLPEAARGLHTLHSTVVGIHKDLRLNKRMMGIFAVDVLHFSALNFGRTFCF
ncbi:hypothetical protein [Fischerella thermalis]|uniref:hypothetical protein n=1 Tax=Fischerella thermalis TaxID=372787 RepID=UPI0003134A0D|nr:hypothetical protein [Fischerella thermalis]